MAEMATGTPGDGTAARARARAREGGRARAGTEDAASEYERLERATAELHAPFALVDLDALWSNADDLVRRAGGKPIRLASKSLRCRALQERVLERDGYRGTLAYTLPEALWLAGNGFDDLVVAYPTADEGALGALARADALRGRQGGGRGVSVMVDCVDQLEMIERACERAGADATVRVCIDVDASWPLLGGRAYVGVKRSPVRTAADAAALAREIVARERLELVGIMAYEAQIAGVPDAPPGRPLRGVLVRAMQRRSARELAHRRAAVVDAVAAVAREGGAELEFVNGGGTGSLEGTSSETAVTEVTAGSGLYAPTLFDAYRAFAPRPAALFVLPVVRRPGRGVVTALGGGYLASGPADAARLPSAYLPAGLRLDRLEGAGEVQTPLLGGAADSLAIGDRVYMRHAKAGELSERFATLHLLEGEEIVDEVPTYRGEGRCFL
jgi:D-serine deaminase-like pyridoxal phosphate-dependent protein